MFKNIFWKPTIMKTGEIVSIINDNIGVGRKGYWIKWLFFSFRWSKNVGSIYELNCLGVPEKYEDGFLNSLPNIIYDPSDFIPYQYKKIYEPNNWKILAIFKKNVYNSSNIIEYKN